MTGSDEARNAMSLIIESQDLLANVRDHAHLIFMALESLHQSVGIGPIVTGIYDLEMKIRGIEDTITAAKQAIQ
jgi:hypothetical protein